MMASYVLSSTLVPVFSTWLTREERQKGTARMRVGYGRFLSRMLKVRWPLVILYLAVSIGLVWVLLPRMGTEIFPDANAPLMRLRMRAPTGTRIEVTERLLLGALDVLKREIGPGNVEITSDFLGLIPSSYPVDLIHLFTSGPQEAIIQVAMKPDTPRGEALRERLRARLQKELPQCHFSFEAGDIVTQVMSFDSPTPIAVAVRGVSLADDYKHAQKVQAELAKLTFLRDLTIGQSADFPTLDINIDRERAGQFGLTMADVARSVVLATSSSRFIQPNYWRDPNSGNAFQIQVQLPQNRMQSVESVGDVPVMQGERGDTRLTDIASLKLGTMPGLIERYNGQHVVSLTANLHGITLGEAATQIEKAAARAGDPPKGVTVKMGGEMPALEQTLTGLRIGLLLAVLVIFLLLAANFQSVRLALAIVLTIPAVLGGVLLMLLITGTSLNVQSFMGAIMAIGIAVANSILLVTFAERARHEGRDYLYAAEEGATGRVRAVLMTAAAMICGILPMAIGFGEGGAQSAPLGRAVIGGLLASTFTTLTVLPAIYAILQKGAGIKSPSLNPLDPESRYYEVP
jgi:multidrug efflux pump subunit AcrB